MTTSTPKLHIHTTTETLSLAVPSSETMQYANLYGTPQQYKPFPEMGDRIRDDGLVAALSSLDGAPLHTEVPDPVLDTLFYATPNALVIARELAEQ